MSLMDLEAIPCECLSCDGSCPHTTTSRTNICEFCAKGEHNVPVEQEARRVNAPASS